MTCRYWGRLFHVILIACAARIFMPGYAHADTSEPLCAAHWRDFVADIQVLMPSPAQNDRVIVFADQEGRIFNCLDQKVPRSILRDVQVWGVALSEAIDANSDDDAIRPDFCNSSYGVVQGVNIMTIYLPYREEFSSPECVTRLRHVPGSVRRFLGAE